MPVTLLLSAMDVAPPEQNACEEGVAVTEGTGFTLTVTTEEAPLQVPAVGVIVYTAVPCVVLVAVKVCVIELPDPLAAPLTPV